MTQLDKRLHPAEIKSYLSFELRVLDTFSNI